jgi:hypothetical protein
MPDPTTQTNTTMPEQALSNPSCSRCTEPHDNWPDDSNGLLCQMCWEAHCSEEWWDSMIKIDGFYSENK